LIEQKKFDQAAQLARQIRTDYGAMSNDDVNTLLDTIRVRRAPNTKPGGA